ncbi:MAG: carbamoyl-phosphate synthase large subunit [Bradymonadia bacterium]|jgi:carbamoyl-phosphate synthase large subunit
MKRILVTGSGGGVGQGIIKALRLLETPVTIIAADMAPLAAGLYAGDEMLIVPRAKAPDYVEQLISLCITHRIDLYLPGTDIELAIAAENNALLEDRAQTKVLVCPPEAIEIADDKMATANFLRDHGFPYPETWEPGDIDADALPYPLIVKPRRGFRSIGVAKVQTPDELRAELDGRTDDPIVQECVATDADEYTCTIAVVGGVASPVLPLRRELRGGDTYKAFPVHHEGIETLVHDVAIALGVRGSCNFQLRLDGDTPKIFEVNARFSGTTPFCAQLGMNPVGFCLSQLWGMPFTSNIRWDVSVLRHWAETVVPNTLMAELVTKGHTRPHGVSTMDLRSPHADNETE